MSLSFRRKKPSLLLQADLCASVLTLMDKFRTEHRAGTTEQGIRVAFKVSYPKLPSKGTVIYFHGFPGGPLDDLTDVPLSLASLGYSVVSFNYPGLWDAESVFSVDNVLNSSRYIISEVKTAPRLLIPETPLILFGESFGGALTVLLAAENQGIIQKVCLRSPLLDFRPILRFLPLTFRQLENAGILRVSASGFDFEQIKKINLRELISSTTSTRFWGVIGNNDEVLPGVKMFDATRGVPHFSLELWDDFPHNSISVELWERFLLGLKGFLDTDD